MTGRRWRSATEGQAARCGTWASGGGGGGEGGWVVVAGDAASAHHWAGRAADVGGGRGGDCEVGTPPGSRVAGGAGEAAGAEEG
jgi:hypothetical protein